MRLSKSAIDCFRIPRILAAAGKQRVRLGVMSLLGSLAAGFGAAALWLWMPSRIGASNEVPPRYHEAATTPATTSSSQRAMARSTSVSLSKEQQRSIGLRTKRVAIGASPRVSTAPGRVAPNENQYAYITPRAAGVVRSVAVHLGQEVKAGDLLATIDSPEVGAARLDLYTKLQTLDVANAQATWEETIYANTLELLRRLQNRETPQQAHNAFADRPVGENRQRLMTAYAQYRLAQATIDRNRELIAQELITPKQFQQVNADYEVAQATYQSLMDQMGYEAMLSNTRAQQARKKAETAVRVAQERLRILGVMADGTQPDARDGGVNGRIPEETSVSLSQSRSTGAVEALSILPPQGDSEGLVVNPQSIQAESGARPKYAPVSTYSISAPFDGTILDREMIVPGIAVDTTHRIFTMANLLTVWVEASVHESDFEVLDRTRMRGGKVRFRSPAYADRVFEGEVIYAGDLVEEQSRTVKLLARAQNPDRLLRPGMFVEVEVLSPRENPVIQIPASALLMEGSQYFVYVRSGPDRFERREVDAEPPLEGSTMIRGLEDGDEVFVEGGYKLKSLADEPSPEDRQA
jgi:membrane fusion protein, heavy metal efflux system